MDPAMSSAPSSSRNFAKPLDMERSLRETGVSVPIRLASSSRRIKLKGQVFPFAETTRAAINRPTREIDNPLAAAMWACGWPPSRLAFAKGQT